MANEEHLKILRQGVEVWNKWREENPDIQPDLSQADLFEAELSGVYLREAALYWADLSGANLARANFSGANLARADLVWADLTGANLAGADLTGANLSGANLSGANLNWVHLWRADLWRADLSGADFSSAMVGSSKFGDIDLSGVKGLDTVIHGGPSTIGIDTIYRSKGNIPEVFLRGAGVPDTFITQIPSLVEQVIKFYSCFISHSSKDQAFAKRLHADLQSEGVRCWFAPEDMKIGDKIRPTLDESIRRHDKLLLVLSKYSVASQWVEQEVETALARERKEGRTMLFPIRLDNAVMEIESGWPTLIQNTRHIGDFRHWKNYGEYQKTFNRLLHDLQREAIRC